MCNFTLNWYYARVVRNRVFLRKYFLTPAETVKNPVSLLLISNSCELICVYLRASAVKKSQSPKYQLKLNQLQKSDLQSDSNQKKFATQSDRSLET